MLDIFRLLFDPEINMIVREALPGSMIQFLEIITILGNGALLFSIAALLYWFDPDNLRRKRLLLLSLAVLTLAVVGGLKGILQVSRPDLAFAPENYPGWSTPSAHAMGATVIYGGLAVLSDNKLIINILQYLGAGSLIFIVALSRVVLGVHYIGDVLLGVILGVVLVYIGIRIKRERTTGAVFKLGILISTGAFILGSEEFITLSLGSSLGGLASWKIVRYKVADPKYASTMIMILMIAPIAITFWVIDAVVLGYIGVDDMVFLYIPVRSLVQMIGYAILFVIAVTLPFMADMINHWEIVHRLEKYIPPFGET